jgi:hypothetical protein
VKYMLGSLCTTSEFGCLHIEYSDCSSVKDCPIYLTDRGRYLISHDHRLFHETSPVEFCFNFHYLQMAIDDKLLALPRSKSKQTFVDADYSYLYLPDREYSPLAPKIVLSKLDAVLNFLHILETFYTIEARRHETLYSRLGRIGIRVDFPEIRAHLLHTIKSLLGAMHRSSDIKRLETLESSLRQDRTLENELAPLPTIAFEVQR